MLWSPTATRWRGPWGQTDGPRALGSLWTMGGGLVGTGLSLYGRVGLPSPLGWFGRKVQFLGRWERLARPGARERGRRARLGAGDVEALPRAMALAQAGGGGLRWGRFSPGPGMEEASWAWDGMGGAPVSGPGDPGTPNTPSQAPHPRWPSRAGGGVGPGSRGWGAPGVPSLVFLERLNGKRLADGGVPYMATGDPPQAPAPPSPGQNPPPPDPIQAYVDYSDRPAFLVGARPQCTSLAAPHFGGGKLKVQTVVPLWAGRHQGGGVAPGCKALAEEAREGPLAPQIPPLCPSAAGLEGRPALPLGPTVGGGGSPISLALRGAQR